MKIIISKSHSIHKEAKLMRKALLLVLAMAVLLAMSGIAFADITPWVYDISSKNWQERMQGTSTYYNPILGSNVNLPSYTGNNTSTHPYGTWNSPYTLGIDGYNYNDSQDYTDDATQVGTGEVRTYEIPGPFRNAIGQMMGAGGPVSQVQTVLKKNFTSGPHGGYLTSTHKCRECHAVHRAAGKFKLTRSNTRFEACDWCHGTGAGSGYNIQMDNNDTYTREYNVGHTMGFGLQSGKWKAPDDTYPAFTPNYWLGGFSCFDCHSPHANPSRIMGYDENGKPIESIVRLQDGAVFNIGNPGHDMFTAGGANFADAEGDPANTYWAPALGGPLPGKSKPYYLAGSWLLIKNPDREIASKTYTNVQPAVYSLQKHYYNGVWGGDGVLYGPTYVQDSAITTITAGSEIPDLIDLPLNEFSDTKAFPVNKIPTDWNSPIGSAGVLDNTNLFGTIVPADPDGSIQNGLVPDMGNLAGYNVRNPFCRSIMLSEFCTDCHDGNAGLHTVQAPLFSEDRALRNQTQVDYANGTDNFKGQYDISYGHDAASRHCGRAMRFNPEDGIDSGPHCRNCHKGSSGCGGCHNSDPMQDLHVTTDTPSISADNSRAAITWLFASLFDIGNTIDPVTFGAMGWGGTMSNPWAPMFYPYSTYNTDKTSTGETNQIAVKLQYIDAGSTEPVTGMMKNPRTVSWTSGWRTSPAINNAACSDDGLSWPHRTLGWKMLKDDLFGIDVTGTTSGDSTVIGVGVTRTLRAAVGSNGTITPANGPMTLQTVTHDLDSVCLDCHNPTIWNATSSTDHTDDPANPTDNYDDELLLRGLP